MNAPTVALRLQWMSDREPNNESLSPKRLGALLQQVTPLLELAPPYGAYLNFRGFRSHPVTLLQRVLNAVDPYVSRAVAVGGFHRDFCMLQAEWVENSSNCRRHASWWTIERMMNQHLHIPLAALARREEDRSFFQNMGLHVWGDVVRIRSRAKRQNCEKRLYDWCSTFPEGHTVWRYYKAEPPVRVKQVFESPLTTDTALLFVMRPLVEEFCQCLERKQLGVSRLLIRAQIRHLPPEDIEADLSDRQHVWQQTLKFEVPLSSPATLHRIINRACSDIPNRSEILQVSLRALQTVSNLIRQKSFFGDEVTTDKMPVWLEEMQQQFGGQNVGFYVPTLKRAPRESYELVGQIKAVAETCPSFQWPLSWLPQKQYLPEGELASFEPLGKFQKKPQEPTSALLTYHRGWLRDGRQILCEFDAELGHWWLHAFFD